MPSDLTVTDALGYLDKVKHEFGHNLGVYGTFLDVMKEFKSQVIDTPGVIEKVSQLFRGRPALIEGFNTFLPTGYSIQCSDTTTYVTVTSPSGASRTISTETLRKETQAETLNGLRSASISRADGPSGHHNHQAQPSHASSASSSRLKPSHQEIGTTAVEYVYKIKQRCDPETYRKFRDLLQQIQNNQVDPENDILTHKIWELFRHDPDLRADFKVFVPDNMPWPPSGVDPDDDEAIDRHRRKRKEREREQSERDREREAAKTKRASRHSDAASSSHHRSRRSHRRDERAERTSDSGHHRSRRHSSRQKTQTSHLRRSTNGPPIPQPPITSTTVLAPKQQPHSNFFDRVRRSLPSREIYNEFLKIVNLFTKGFIDTKRLLEESQNFLSKELMDIFVEILGHDATRSIGVGPSASDEWNGTRPELVEIPIVQERPEVSRTRIGSYRCLPASEANVLCSGRDEMCKSVLNDEWVLNSNYVPEDDQVSAATPTLTAVTTTRNKKPTDTQAVVPIQHTNIRHNPFLEALHRSEEERHEYGFHIDAIGRTISMLEPINHKIMTLATPEERMAFRVKGGFGLPSSGFGGVPINGAGSIPGPMGAPPNAQMANQTKPIHHRIIRKIYGLEDGNKVLQAMQDSPGSAVPTIIVRLKQKEAEWKRAQSEWNKVWRLMDETNYARALDFMALTSASYTFGAGNKDGTLVGGYSVSGGGVNSYGTGWKGKDKRLFQPSALVREIEIIREEQARERGNLVDRSFGRGKKRWQLEFAMEDIGGDVADDNDKEKTMADPSSSDAPPNSTIPTDTLQTVHLLLFSFLDRTPVNQISVQEKKKIEGFLKGFAALFWNVDLFFLTNHTAGVPSVPTTGGTVASGQEDVEMSEEDDTASATSLASGSKKNSSKRGKTAATGSGDLRKKLLKSEQAKSRKGKTADNGMRFFTDILPSKDGGTLKVGKTVFWTNNNFYVLLRMLELFYSRMKLFKDLSKQSSTTRKATAMNQASSSVPSTEAMAVDQSPSRGAASYPEHDFYAILLDSIEKLFDNEMEQSAFEDLVRRLYGVQQAYKVYTVDKLIGAIIKQVQTIFVDPKSQDLLEILKTQKLGNQDPHQDSRDKVEELLNSDDNLYRVDWNPESRLLTMQLIGKEDSALDDSDAMRDRWLRYIESYVSMEQTIGVPQEKVRRPFLRRNLPKTGVMNKTPTDMITRDDFGIKICVRTYRMFYVDEGEDVLWRHSRGIPTTTRRRQVDSVILDSLRQAT